MQIYKISNTFFYNLSLFSQKKENLKAFRKGSKKEKALSKH